MESKFPRNELLGIALAAIAAAVCAAIDYFTKKE